MIDKDLQQHVQNALDWEPSVDAKDIGVSVDEGVVISSSPAGGGTAPKGSTVDVFVSKGPRPFPMPNFVGRSPA